MKKDNTLILNKIKSHYGLKSDADFARFLGIKPNTLHNWYTRNTLDYEVVITKCVDINADWLLTGVGEMLKANIQSNATAIGEIEHPSDGSPYVKLGDNQFLMIVPLIPIKASAGYRENFQDENYVDTHYDKHYFPVTRQYRGKYFAFVVDGDSMDDGTSEAIIEGSTVTAREIKREHWRNRFHLNSFKDYVIVHRDVILVKRIIEHDTESGTILCHSLNDNKKRHPDFVLNLDECLQILNIVNVTQPR